MFALPNFFSRGQYDEGTRLPILACGSVTSARTISPRRSVGTGNLRAFLNRVPRDPRRTNSAAAGFAPTTQAVRRSREDIELRPG